MKIYVKELRMICKLNYYKDGKEIAESIISPDDIKGHYKMFDGELVPEMDLVTYQAYIRKVVELTK